MGENWFTLLEHRVTLAGAAGSRCLRAGRKVIWKER